VIGFTREEDARRVMEVLPKRFGKYGLKIHPDKTRLVPFRRPPWKRRDDGSDNGGSGTFDLLASRTIGGDPSRATGGEEEDRERPAQPSLKAIHRWCKTLGTDRSRSSNAH